MAVAPLKVGIVGLGNVGTGVARILTDHPHRIAERAGRPIVLKRAVVRNLNKPRDIRLESGVLTNDIQAVINDPEITVAMELMGDSSRTRSHSGTSQSGKRRRHGQ